MWKFYDAFCNVYCIPFSASARRMWMSLSNAGFHFIIVALPDAVRNRFSHFRYSRARGCLDSPFSGQLYSMCIQGYLCSRRERGMLAYVLFDFWSTVDNSGIYWKQETEAGGVLYIDSVKLILLNKNVSHYWLNKHMFCGRCQAAVIYYPVWYRNMAFNWGDGSKM
jgi:hypothetical protein